MTDNYARSVEACRRIQAATIGHSAAVTTNVAGVWGVHLPPAVAEKVADMLEQAQNNRYRRFIQDLMNDLLEILADDNVSPALAFLLPQIVDKCEEVLNESV